MPYISKDTLEVDMLHQGQDDLPSVHQVQNVEHIHFKMWNSKVTDNMLAIESLMNMAEEVADYVIA
jgi:hypothetical protein